MVDLPKVNQFTSFAVKTDFLVIVFMQGLETRVGRFVQSRPTVAEAGESSVV